MVTGTSGSFASWGRADGTEPTRQFPESRRTGSFAATAEDPHVTGGSTVDRYEARPTSITRVPQFRVRVLVWLLTGGTYSVASHTTSAAGSSEANE